MHCVHHLFFFYAFPIVDRYRFSFNYSAYSGEKLTTQSEIKGDGSFSMTVNSSRLEIVKGKTQTLKEALITSCEDIKNVHEEVSRFFFKSPIVIIIVVLVD